MILGGLPAGIVARVVSCLTENTLSRMEAKRETVIKIEIVTEIATETEIIGTKIIVTEIGIEQGVATEIEIMIEREIAGVIMIETGILKGRAAEGIEMLTDILITAPKEAGAGAEAGVGAKAGGLHLLFVTIVSIIIQAPNGRKKKRELQHQAIWQSLKIYTVT